VTDIIAHDHATEETAQQVLGHSSKQTTERHYAEVDLSRAKANALQFG
jgi:integrase